MSLLAKLLQLPPSMIMRPDRFLMVTLFETMCVADFAPLSLFVC
jgi:hypothetical protein